MNYLLQIMPMPIIMHGCGGHFNPTPCAGVTLIISGFFLFLGLIFLTLYIVLNTFDHEDKAKICLRIAAILLFLCILLLGITFLFNFIGW